MSGDLPSDCTCEINLLPEDLENRLIRPLETMLEQSVFSYMKNTVTQLTST